MKKVLLILVISILAACDSGLLDEADRNHQAETVMLEKHGIEMQCYDVEETVHSGNIAIVDVLCTVDLNGVIFTDSIQIWNFIT